MSASAREWRVALAAVLGALATLASGSSARAVESAEEPGPRRWTVDRELIEGGRARLVDLRARCWEEEHAACRAATHLEGTLAWVELGASAYLRQVTPGRRIACPSGGVARCLTEAFGPGRVFQAVDSAVWQGRAGDGVRRVLLVPEGGLAEGRPVSLRVLVEDRTPRPPHPLPGDGVSHGNYGLKAGSLVIEEPIRSRVTLDAEPTGPLFAVCDTGLERVDLSRPAAVYLGHHNLLDDLFLRFDYRLPCEAHVVLGGRQLLGALDPDVTPVMSWSPTPPADLRAWYALPPGLIVDVGEAHLQVGGVGEDSACHLQLGTDVDLRMGRGCMVHHLGDLNGDGRADAVVREHGESGCTATAIWLSRADGGWEQVGSVHNVC